MNMIAFMLRSFRDENTQKAHACHQKVTIPVAMIPELTINQS